MMPRARISAVLVVMLTVAALAAPAAAQETYAVDPVHSSVVFRIKHLDAGYFYGNFNEITGTFTLQDSGAEHVAFDLTVPVESIYTRNERRDAHLKSADFFDAEKFPEITFKSTSASRLKAEGTVYEVTGDLTIHGVTRPVTVRVEMTGQGQDQQGNRRAGVETVFDIKRSDFGMTTMLGPVGDEVRLMVSLEGVVQQAEAAEEEAS